MESQQTVNIIVKKCDMKEDMKEKILSFAREALTYNSQEQEVAEKLKMDCDRAYGPAWHCIVGRNYGVQISHTSGHFITFYIEALAFTVYKTNA
ncbi:hypothetical protein HZS_5827 [Henneguya salminicola]|nr:hypothetical protein HZS_5827 [Henneguya salminicola]